MSWLPGVSACSPIPPQVFGSRFASTGVCQSQRKPIERQRIYFGFNRKQMLAAFGAAFTIRVRVCNCRVAAGIYF
jgi:hypothetical protein